METAGHICYAFLDGGREKLLNLAEGLVQGRDEGRETQYLV